MSLYDISLEYTTIYRDRILFLRLKKWINLDMTFKKYLII